MYICTCVCTSVHTSTRMSVCSSVCTSQCLPLSIHNTTPTLVKPEWTEQGVVGMASWHTRASGSYVCPDFGVSAWGPIPAPDVQDTPTMSSCCVNMYVCMYVCRMYVIMYVCISIWYECHGRTVCAGILPVWVRVCVRMYVCMYAMCVCVQTYVRTFPCSPSLSMLQARALSTAGVVGRMFPVLRPQV